MPAPELPRDEAEAALAARQDLDRDMEPAVVEAFVDRIERSIDARVDARLERHGHAPRPGPAQSGGFADVALPVSSLIFAIPLTAIAGGTVGLVGILVVWIGIVLVNLADHAMRG